MKGTVSEGDVVQKYQKLCLTVKREKFEQRPHFFAAGL